MPGIRCPRGLFPRPASTASPPVCPAWMHAVETAYETGPCFSVNLARAWLFGFDSGCESVGIIVVGDEKLDGRSRSVFLRAQDGEPFGLHGDFEDRDLLGPGGFAVGDEPERVSMECIRRVFRRRDDQKTGELWHVFQRGEFRGFAFALVGRECKRRLYLELGVGRRGCA